jgi:cell division protein FtsI/penicillin-binding protein 2
MQRAQRLRRHNYALASGRRVLPRRPAVRLWRIQLVQYLLGLVGAVVVLRLFQIQILDRDYYVALANEQYLLQITVRAQRGPIYDRNGKELALNKPCYELGLYVKSVNEPKTTAKKLSKILKKSEREILNQIRSGKSFVWLTRKLEEEAAAAIEKMKLPGVTLIESSERVYPLNEKAAQVIGFVDIDGKGLSGIESAYDKYLKGLDGWSLLQKDAKGNTVMPIESATREPQDGDEIILTLDHVLQTIAEEELANAVSRYDAKGGSVVITNPNTGEVLALASVPGFNANQARKYASETWRIRSVTDIFEPGSTFKIVTMTAALFYGIKKTNDIVFGENGKFTYFGEEINDPEKHGWLSLRNVLKFSSNIGTVKIADEVGKAKLYKIARDYGFGNKTGIGLSGEVSGILKKPTFWSNFSLAAVAIGHEVAVTPLQMAMAYGAIANGGLLMKPAIIKQIKSKDKKILKEFQPQVIRRVMDRKTANTLAAILEEVVEDGTGQLAKIPGYRIAGKTGTAQKPWESKAGYSDTKFVASFAGFYPANQPELLIFLMLDEPYPTHSGGHVAAPTFRNILTRIIKLYDKSHLRYTENSTTEIKVQDTVTIPNLVGRRLETATNILKDLDIKFKLVGQGVFVKKQELKEQVKGRKNPEIILTLSDFPINSDYTMVPNLVGLSLRSAVNKLYLKGLEVQILGSGRVVRQDPPPGTKIKVGARCFLECAPVTNIKLINNLDPEFTKKYLRD